MSERHTEDNTPRDASDEALDILMAGADADLQEALGAALNVDDGLAAIVGKGPGWLGLRGGLHTPTVGVGGLGSGAGAVPPFGTRSPGGMTGATGRGFAGAGAGMAGRGGDADDEEHALPSYLVEADPADVFGTDETCAPPVIGEEEDS